MLRDPPNGDPYLKEMAAIIRAEFLRKEAVIVGFRNDGTDLHIRFRAMPFVPFYQVHVQNTAAGNGDGTYSNVDFLTSVEVDCREERLQDVEIVLAPGETHFVWLIPIEKDGLGDAVLYNGLNGVPDLMSFIEVGA